MSERISGKSTPTNGSLTTRSEKNYEETQNCANAERANFFQCENSYFTQRVKQMGKKSMDQRHQYHRLSITISTNMGSCTHPRDETQKGQSAS